VVPEVVYVETIESHIIYIFSLICCPIKSLPLSLFSFVTMICRFSNLIVLVSSVGLLCLSDAFVPATNSFISSRHKLFSAVEESSAVKPTGTSFLPEDTIERAKIGSPIEKIKLAKDGTAAFVDVYEFARKIREGEMTWEEVEKSDLDTVS
jgi:hypothetical protein